MKKPPGGFFIVVVAWVFFRADTLPAAWRYLGCMFGWVANDGHASVARGLIYAPYYLVNFILAGAVIWGLPQSWDFTRRLRPWKAAWAAAVFLVAVLMLATQSFNPFIYFIF